MANPSPDKAELNLIEQAVMDVVLSREGKRRYNNGDSLTLDPSDLRDIVRLTMAKCATPPSPSTTPEVHYAVVDDLRIAAQCILKRWDTPLWRQEVGTAELMNRLRAALASRPAEFSIQHVHGKEKDKSSQRDHPAEVDDEGLPPLPPEAARAMKGEAAFFVKWQDAGKDLRGALMLYTAEQFRQGQRDAVAADRARRSKGVD